MTPYFFKQMRKRTSLCLVVVLTALAFSLALCMLQRSRDRWSIHRARENARAVSTTTRHRLVRLRICLKK